MDYQSEKDELKYYLDSGQIDLETYEYEINRIEKKRLKKEKKEKEKKEKSIYVDREPKSQKYIVIIILIISIGAFIFNNINLGRRYEIVNSLSYIEKPKQSSTSGGTTKTVRGTKAVIEYKAEYEITGRVVDVQKYNDVEVFGQISPIDIGLAWGVLSKAEVDKKIKWFSAGDRVLRVTVDDGTWLNSVGGFTRIEKCFSNNHLIPSSDEVYDEIKSIRVGNYVRIKGYLVSVTYTRNGMTRYIASSTSREDEGLGACEVIYVTDVVFLRKK